MGNTIEQQAEQIEKEAESGYTVDVVYRHLHNVEEKDRVAVAKEIEKRNTAGRKTNEALPKLEFDIDGDLKAVEKHDKYSSVRVELDDQGRKICQLEGWPDTSWKRSDYDPTTGWLKSVREKYADGTYEQTEIDPVTHNFKSVKRQDQNGNPVENTEYDSTTGNKKSSFLKHKDGSVSQTEYDPQTEKLKSEQITSRWGTPESRKYDPPGHLVSDELNYKDDATVNMQFDALSGELTSADRKMDGSTVHGKIRKLESGNFMIEYEDRSSIHVIFDKNHNIERVIRSNRRGDPLH